MQDELHISATGNLNIITVIILVYYNMKKGLHDQVIGVLKVIPGLLIIS